LNNCIEDYNGDHIDLDSMENEHEIKKRIFEIIDANLPAGYLLESHWTANYEVLRNIYHGRRNHKMYWWQEFCDIIEKLPYFELLIKDNK
jgi:hypothetical protein